MYNKCMKKIILLICIIIACSGCKEVTYEKIPWQAKVTDAPELIVIGVAPEGMYFSELTGEPISLDIQNQRPIAVMVDNEILAYPHFGISEADVVYEMVNSLHNGRITRLMALKKDYAEIEQMGSIRSTRDTNILLQAEWNSILVHDGASSISLPLFSNPYATEHINGTLSRVDNGKSREFTEYILPGDIESNIKSGGFSKDYNEYKPNVESHFQFVKYLDEEVLTEGYDEATYVALPFPHNGSELKYNEKTSSYDYYCYGDIHVDGEDEEVLTFKNVIIQNIDMIATDNEGHVRYMLEDSGKEGYYLSNGHVQKITWEKKDEMDITRYYDENGNELVINIGNTYIGLVPSDAWGELVVE